MTCRGCLECLLKLLNFILTLVGLAIVGYGIYLLVEFMKVADSANMHSPVGETDALIQLGRPMLTAVSLSSNFFDNLPKAWFIYLFIGVGVIIFVISCFGCISIVTRNGCCLSCYSVLLILLILVELAAAAFIFFDKSWQTEIPTDTTGDFDMIYDFLEAHWNIVKWVVLGAVIFEALMFLLALGVRAVNRPVEYDSDEEPLINRPPPVPATGVPVAGASNQRPIRNDAWSTRMREKYGLDTSLYPYDPSDSSRFQQPPAQPQEERRRCSIM
ncbi:tobamovirus multiplication protein 2A [Rosa sericea]